ncbi:MAG: hypothetical protein WD967_01785 [Candidatus Levyibacteriota bacterium]
MNNKKVLDREAHVCPYCGSKKFVKRGTRKNKYQEVQLYLCRGDECGRTFTSRTVKGKQFPWLAVLDSISYYNFGYDFKDIPKFIEAKHGVSPKPETIAKWYEEYKSLCRFERLRPYALKILGAWQEHAKKHGHTISMIETTTLAHKQLYRFRYHRPKLALMLEEYGNRNFAPLMEYLDSVSTQMPHEAFLKGGRISEVKSKFSKAEMIVKTKKNFATDLTKFVIQSVVENKKRHEEVQRFFIANDSVTIATEVPVYISQKDVSHMEKSLNFKILEDNNRIQFKGKKKKSKFPELLTGHIDLVQVRNGQIHILDYKPNASKEKPIEQLTWYAIAMSRLTGLRLFEFKCAWFDEEDYFEFYPLHVVKKSKRKRSKRVKYKDGSSTLVPTEDNLKIV